MVLYLGGKYRSQNNNEKEMWNRKVHAPKQLFPSLNLYSRPGIVESFIWITTFLTSKKSFLFKKLFIVYWDIVD